MPASVDRFIENIRIYIERESYTLERESRNLFRINTEPISSLLYVKISNSNTGFWGLTKNQLKRFENRNIKWFAILLARDSNVGYIFTSEEVFARIKDGSFELSGDGDYKVNEKSDCDNRRMFNDIDTVVARLLK